jgi:hypothetical protein
MVPLAASNTLTQEENANHRSDLDGSLSSFQDSVDPDRTTEILLVSPPQSQRSEHDEVLATQVDDAVHGGTFGFANIINSKYWQLRLMMQYMVVPSDFFFANVMELIAQ